MAVIVTANGLRALLYSSSLDSLPASCNGSVPPWYQRCEFLVGRLAEWREENEPALAVAARAAGQLGREHEIERRDPPFVFGQIPFPVQPVRLQEIRGRIVIAMRVLHAREDRELPLRPHVDFELRHAVDDVIVDALAVAAVRFPAGLPVALENIA